MGTTSILIVEDDFIVAKVIEKSLLELGYRIIGMVSTGQDAVALAKREQPDLVLMDINLHGDMDGIAAADLIHMHEGIPVIFLTAFSDKVTFSRALETAPYGYIIKPFQTNTLATTIEVALNKYRLEEQKAVRHHWLEGTLQSLSDGVVTVDIQGRITLINPVAGKMTGWNLDTAIGQPLNRVLMFGDPVTGKKGTIAINPVLSEGIVTTLPEGSHLLSSSGTYALINEAIASPVRDEKGTITGAAIVIYPAESASPVAGAPAGEVPGSPKQPSDMQRPFPERRKTPVSADDWNDRGNSLMFTRRFDDAKKAYDHAIAISPTNYQAWYGKGTALAKLGMVDEALEAYDQVLSIHPRNSQVLMAKGVILKKAGRDAEADRCFELAHLYQP